MGGQVMWSDGHMQLHVKFELRGWDFGVKSLGYGVNPDQY